MSSQITEWLECRRQNPASLLDLRVSATDGLDRHVHACVPSHLRSARRHVRPEPTRLERHPLQRHGLLEAGRDLLFLLPVAGDPAGKHPARYFLVEPAEGVVSPPVTSSMWFVVARKRLPRRAGWREPPDNLFHVVRRCPQTTPDPVAVAYQQTKSDTYCFAGPYDFAYPTSGNKSAARRNPSARSMDSAGNRMPRYNSGGWRSRAAGP
jgi:hypothetical protein